MDGGIDGLMEGISVTKLMLIALLAIFTVRTEAADIGGQDLESPQYFQRGLKEIIEIADKAPAKSYPRTQKLKRVTAAALQFCHIIETNAHLTGQIYLRERSGPGKGR